MSGMVKERKAKYKDLHTKNNIAGTCLCITALIPLFVGAIVDADNDLFLMIMLSFSFLIAGIGVICFIKTGIIWASYEKLLQEGEYSKENKENRLLQMLYILHIGQLQQRYIWDIVYHQIIGGRVG